MSAYHRLPIADKRRLAIAQVREPFVRCPACDTQLIPADVPAHVRERCTGRPEPHPLARWVTWREAVAMGMSAATLNRAVATGVVRARGKRSKRVLLLRDVVLELARSALAAKPTAGGGEEGVPLGPSGGDPHAGDVVRGIPLPTDHLENVSPTEPGDPDDDE